MTPEERRARLQRMRNSQEHTTERYSSYDQSLAGEEGYATGETVYRRRTSSAAPKVRSSAYSGRRNRSSRRRRKDYGWLKVLIAFLISAAIILGAVFLVKALVGKKNGEEETTMEAVVTAETETETTQVETTALSEVAEEVLTKARLMAAQYDYDGAEKLISDTEGISELEDVKAFLTELNETKATLVEQDISKITHIFFHILLEDVDNALDESRWGSQAKGYNSLMTTIPEFEKILEKMYERGYVLVSLHDMAYEETQADGSKKMVKGSIMLPPGKQAFVMSEDDVCYYEYMEGAGFADKMIIGEDGKPTTHYTDKDGNEFVGDYDIVPILDKFIEEHPDFSYHGHKACLVFTGYNGVLGYRTDETYLPENYVEHKVEGGHDVEAERAEAVKVLKALYEDGYDLGSHSWGHRDMGAMSYDALVTDMEKWDKNVNSLIKEATGKDTDILIYPKGADIGDWRGYTSSDQAKEGCLQKFNYLYGKGFRYFCNVDSSQYWVQLGDTFLRTGRRALDGYNFYYDITNNKGRFTDLWDNTSEIFDTRRPTPVESY